MIRLAITSHDQGYSSKRNEEEIDTWINNNTDLLMEDDNGNARRDLRKMMDPILKGYLPILQKFAEERIDLEPAGTPMRFYHIFMAFVDRALAHSKGPGSAIREIKQEIMKLRPKVKSNARL